jgi:hypothetical protein
LADFLSEGPTSDQGQACFGDLILPAIEKLAETWAHELDIFWIAAKEAVSQHSATRGEIPDYLGINAIYERFQEQPDDVREAARTRMVSLLSTCKELSAGQPIDLLGRVSVIFDARP